MITYELLRAWMSADEFRPARVPEWFADRCVSPREVAADEGVSGHGRLWILSRALWHRNRAAAQRLAIDSAASMSALVDHEVQADHVSLVASLLPALDLQPDARIAERRAWGARWNAIRKASYEWNAFRTRVALASACGGHLPALEPISEQVAAWDAAWDASGDSHISAWCALLGPYWAAHDSDAKERALMTAISKVVAALGDDADGWVVDCEVAA